jgi:hypothetical protein
MANELTIASSALFVKGLKRVSFNKGSSQVDVSGTDYFYGTQIAAISGGGGAALDKGNVTALGLFIGKNNDATTAINILAATGGTVIISIPPLAVVSFFFGSGVTAPFVISSSASLTAELEYLIVEA